MIAEIGPAFRAVELADALLERLGEAPKLGPEYTLFDVGSQRAHGALTHRLQWYAVIDAFEESPGNWYHTPLELYTAIGAFDRNLVEENASRRFRFERQGSLWAAIFDQGASTLEQIPITWNHFPIPKP